MWAQVVFHTAFHTKDTIMDFDKFRVDYSHKDRHHHEYVSEFGMSLHFADTAPEGGRCALTLVVQVVSASNLLSNDSNGLSDPQVKLCVASAWVQTHYVPRTLNPTWNETLELPIHKIPVELEVCLFVSGCPFLLGSDSLYQARAALNLAPCQIIVEDRDLIGSDEAIGLGNLRITQERLGRHTSQPKRFDVQLRDPGGSGKDGSAGALILEVSVKKEFFPDEYWQQMDFLELCKHKGKNTMCRSALCVRLT